MVDLTNTAPGQSWQATFSGPALVLCWGAGGGGAGGVFLSKGGSGGGGGAMAYKAVTLIAGNFYSYSIGAGGAGGAFGGSAGGDGGNTTWGANVCKAAGGKGAKNNTAGGFGGTVADSIGDGRQPGENGEGVPSGTAVGGAGGNGGGTAGGAGGTIPIGNGQGAGVAGTAPGGGGGGSGGAGQAGAAGARGLIRVIEAPLTVPGFYYYGRAAVGSGAYSTNGEYNWPCPADGIVLVECYGGGGGARGGLGGTYGASGAGGGAYSLRAVPVQKGCTYQRYVPKGGLGALWNQNNATDGEDAEFRQITDKNGNSITPIVLVRAKGGARSTSGNLAGRGLGGAAADGIGDTKNSGYAGTNSLSNNQLGGPGGPGGDPNGGLGGLGGRYGTNTLNTGLPGQIPGGGGGGGHAQTNSNNPGNGAAGAQGAVTQAYYLSFGSAAVLQPNGKKIERYITRITYCDAEGDLHEIDYENAYRIDPTEDDPKVQLATCRPDLSVTVRTPPAYIPAGNTAAGLPRSSSVPYASLFDVEDGSWNWSTPNLDAALAAKDAEILVLGDSVVEGWNALTGTFPFLGVSKDFPTAWPRMMRNDLATAKGTIIGGTGLIRTASVSGGDDQWGKSGWTNGPTSDKAHYIESSNVDHIATFKSNLPGTAVSVVTCGPGTAKVMRFTESTGYTLLGYTDGAATGVVSRKVFTGLPDGLQTIVIQPAGTGNVVLLAADVHYPGVGVKVHNLAQGGAKAAGTGQDCFADFTGGAPARMVPTYSQSTGLIGRRPHALLIMLGGNDAFQGIADAVVKAAHNTIGSAWYDNTKPYGQQLTDVILCPDIHATSTNVAIMELCVEKGWSMVDLWWLSRELAAIKGLGYNGDEYGHLNPTGAKWVGGLMSRAIVGPVAV